MLLFPRLAELKKLPVAPPQFTQQSTAINLLNLKHTTPRSTQRTVEFSASCQVNKLRAHLDVLEIRWHTLTTMDDPDLKPLWDSFSGTLPKRHVVACPNLLLTPETLRRRATTGPPTPS